MSGSSSRKETEARMSAREEGFWKARERRVVGVGRLILLGRDSWSGRWREGRVEVESVSG